MLAIGDGGVKIRNAQGEEEFLAADTVISAVARRRNQELFHELEWMIDEVRLRRLARATRPAGDPRRLPARGADLSRLPNGS